MSTAADTSEPSATPQKPPAGPQHNAPTGQPMDKYAAARHAKKKQRRRAHRATLKRPNTSG
jgi:hypothetical protein